MSKQPKPKCLVTKCQRPSIIRGLCKSCYVTIRQLIKKGEVTDEELVSRGKLLPIGKKGRPKSSGKVAEFLAE